MKRTMRRISSLAAGVLILATSGCRSYWIETDVENQTGEPIHELEVDYPSASFGVNTLAPGSVMHYRFQIRGNGPVKVEYTFENGKTTRAQGLNLAEHQKGHLVIRLFPQGKVDFLPKLEPAS